MDGCEIRITSWWFLHCLNQAFGGDFASIHSGLDNRHQTQNRKKHIISISPFFHLLWFWYTMIYRVLLDTTDNTLLNTIVSNIIVVIVLIYLYYCIIITIISHCTISSFYPHSISIFARSFTTGPVGPQWVNNATGNLQWLGPSLSAAVTNTWYNTYIYIYIYKYTLHYLTLPYLTLHYITLHYIHMYVYINMCVCVCPCVNYQFRWPVRNTKSNAGNPNVSISYKFQSWRFKSYIL